eukprot:UN34402
MLVIRSRSSSVVDIHITYPLLADFSVETSGKLRLKLFNDYKDRIFKKELLFSFYTVAFNSKNICQQKNLFLKKKI